MGKQLAYAVPDAVERAADGTSQTTFLPPRTWRVPPDQLRSFDSRRIAASCREVNMQIVDPRRLEKVRQNRLKLSSIDQSVINHHSVRIERPHCKNAAAQLENLVADSGQCSGRAAAAVQQRE